MKGKVIDKGTGVAMPNVRVMLKDENNAYVEGDPGFIGTETDLKGKYQFDLSPGLFLSFEAPGYRHVVKDYSALIKSGTVVLDDASGTGLDKKEVEAYINDARKVNSGQWLIYTGIGLLVLVIMLILAKKLGWF